MADAATITPLRRILHYGIRPGAIAIFFVLTAFFWTLLLQHAVAYPFLLLFLLAVMGSAWFGGRIAGLVSVVLSIAVVDYFFVPPLFSFYVNQVSQTYCIAFIVCAIAMSLVSSARQRTESAIREARDLLEQRVEERTAELVRSNLEIQESERRLRTLTEAIPQQIWSANIYGTIEYCNQHLLDYLGCAIAEIRGPAFFHIFHPEDAEDFREAWQQSCAAGRNLEGEWRVRGANGVYRWFLIRSVPQTTAAGAIARWYGTHIDTEERRRAEQGLAQAQAELSNLSHRLSMGELAASIAHELNQPLTAVVTNAYACREWLRATPANLERASTTAERIVQESKRASDVVARVRALFRKEIDSRGAVDLNRLIQDLARLLHDDAIRRKVVLHLDLDPRLPKVTVDPVQIQQVLLNLATNGMDCMSAQLNPRELIIRSCRSAPASQHGEPDYIEIEVQDTGAGIDPAIAASIFDPFFTTKAQGIGMGLSISRTIIEAHDGRLWATPAPGGGSSFHFTLPLASPTTMSPART
jgi:PAS domain S-box-containing protein